MASDVNQAVDSVSIAQPRVLVDQNSGTASFKGSQTVTHRIGEQLSLSGAHSALVQGQQSVSYNQLHHRMRNIAVHLNGAGVVRKSRVAILLPRDIRLPQVLLSVHVCGACFVPIDSNQPNSRIQDILSSARPQLLISTPQLTADISFDNIIMVEDLFNCTGNFDKTAESNSSLITKWPSVSDVAYIMYTSGSTGKPKGVAISHRALANYIHWAVHFYAGNDAVDMALFTPIGFDLTITSLFLPLITGGTLHTYSEAEYSAVEALAAVLEDDLVDIVKLTPAHLSMLSDEQCCQSKRVKQFIVGGEDLPAALANRIHTGFNGQVLIHNEYGPTEATVGCVVHTFNPAIDTEGSVPIGLPVAGSHVRVLNQSGQDQLPGCSGELYIGGPSLANGYWSQESLTQSQFRSGSRGF